MRSSASVRRGRWRRRCTPWWAASCRCRCGAYGIAPGELGRHSSGAWIAGELVRTAVRSSIQLPGECRYRRAAARRRQARVQTVGDRARGLDDCLADVSWSDLGEAERSIFGLDHGEVGRHRGSTSWNLPPRDRDRHPRPSRRDRGPDSRSRSRSPTTSRTRSPTTSSGMPTAPTVAALLLGMPDDEIERVVERDAPPPRRVRVGASIRRESAVRSVGRSVSRSSLPMIVHLHRVRTPARSRSWKEPLYDGLVHEHRSWPSRSRSGGGDRPPRTSGTSCSRRWLSICLRRMDLVRERRARDRPVSRRGARHSICSDAGHAPRRARPALGPARAAPRPDRGHRRRRRSGSRSRVLAWVFVFRTLFRTRRPRDPRTGRDARRTSPSTSRCSSASCCCCSKPVAAHPPYATSRRALGSSWSATWSSCRSWPTTAT